MAKATLNKVDPVPTPPPTITLELSIAEARLILATTGKVNGTVCDAMGLEREAVTDRAPSYTLYDAVLGALSDAGVSQASRDYEARILGEKLKWNG